jgi:HD-GYP domain-containing protein (c-di-GMP phosphodiesterase class II)/DNA-binding CsgD family transcriptional regulator
VQPTPKRPPSADPGAAVVAAIDLLGALSLAADMAMGLAAGHGVRATYIGMRIADVLGLPPAVRADLFYAELLMDAGCTAWASQVAATILGDDIAARRQLFFFSDMADPRSVLRWLMGYMARGERPGTRLRHALRFAVRGRPFMLEGLQNTSEVAARMAGRLERSAGVQEALRFAFERWDGTGPGGRSAGSIPLVSRIVYASIFLEVFHQAAGRSAAVSLARARRGRTLDPEVVDAFLRAAADDEFWRGLEGQSTFALVRALEPDSPARSFPADRLDDAARAFGDFADLKSFYSAGHSRRVARLAERTASSMGLSPADVEATRRAALLHDLGLVAVPSFVLHKSEARRSEAERESLRLHPYHGDRILSRVPAFDPARPLVAAHHEQPDGRGYPQGLGRDRLALGAAALAAADRFDDLTHAGPERPALAPEAALRELERQSGTGLSPDALAALRRVVDAADAEAGAPASGPGPTARPPPADATWPSGLTDREVEVLRLLSTGASRGAMAARLAVSEHTVRHHLEHIYAKIDVRTRVEATLFAMEHGLLT